MSRLANVIKGGFFPTPAAAYSRIPAYLEPLYHPYNREGRNGRLLDPCCGTGEAALYLAHQLDLQPYGIEINEYRAAQAKNLWEKGGHRRSQILCADYTQVYAAHNFTILFLNPPYDYDPTSHSRRLEYQFLRDTTKWLQAEGILIYLIPRYRLSSPMAKYLASRYTAFTIAQFPEPHYDAFKQIVIMARKKTAAIQDNPTAEKLRTIGATITETNPLPILEATRHAQKYPLPPLIDTPFTFRAKEVDINTLLQAALTQGAWHTPEWQSWTHPPDTLTPIRPVMPLKKGHLAMIMAAGLMQNAELRHADGTHLMVKGRTHKETISIEPGPDQPSTTQIFRDQYHTTINTLDLTTGQITCITTPEHIQAFMDKWQEPLSQQVIDTFIPRYQFDYETTTSSAFQHHLHTLGTNRRPLPGAPPGLLPTQKHVAAALTRLLHQRDYGILVGEMGTGKTTIAITISRLLHLTNHSHPTLVICPPHLVPKWKREIHELLPSAHVQIIKTTNDVDNFMTTATAPLYRSKLAIALASREMIKRASGWIPAYCSKPIHLGYNKNREPLIRSVYTCPDCGAIQRDKNEAIITDPEYFSRRRKRKCSTCHAPLYQYTRHNRQPTNNLIQTTKPSKASYPLAKYIYRYYRHQFKLLILDEVHQFKGGSTDQGYAMHHLVRACRKTLCLTGTIFGGRSTSLFYLLYRLIPTIATKFQYRQEQAWAQRYGILERTIKGTKQTENGTQTGNKRFHTTVKELPGISPELITLLLDSTVFLAIADLGYEMPQFIEVPVTTNLATTPRIYLPRITQDKQLRHVLDRDEHGHPRLQAYNQEELYTHLAHTLRAAAKRLLKSGDKGLLSVYLQACLSAPNAPWRAEIARHPRSQEVLAHIPPLPQTTAPQEAIAIALAYATARCDSISPSLYHALQQQLTAAYDIQTTTSAPILYPKEQWLVDCIQNELRTHRHVLLYVRQTSSRDIQPHLQNMLTQHIPGLRVTTLNSTIGTTRREAWVTAQTTRGLDVLITNPKLVEVGMDLVYFQTIIFYELDYSLYTMQQASRRVWRLGQTRDVVVYYPVYHNTMEHQAMALIAQKLAAASLVYGDAAESVLVQQNGSGGSFLTELARNVMENTSVTDLHDLFQRAAQPPTPPRYIGQTSPPPPDITTATIDLSQLFTSSFTLPSTAEDEDEPTPFIPPPLPPLDHLIQTSLF